MPWGDGTGPGGAGPMTGRAAGYCAGYSVPGYQNPVPGRGFGGRGGGRGGGFGWRNRYYATGVPGWAAFGRTGGWSGAPYAPVAGQLSGADERDLLQRQASNMESALEDLRRRIGEIEAESKKAK